MTPTEAAEAEYPLEDPRKVMMHDNPAQYAKREAFVKGAGWQASQPTHESQWPTAEEIEREALLLYPTVDEERNPNVNRIIGFERAAFKACAQWLQTSGVREGTESYPVRHALSIANGDIDRLEASLRELVEGYESWEAELISDNKCWGPEGMNSYPTLTESLYDKMIELQGKRNEAKKLLSKTI